MAGSEARMPWAIDPERRAKLLDLLDTQLRRAETAEAYAAWMVDSTSLSMTPEVFATGERLLRDYLGAREAVRKLEGQSDGS